MGEIIKFPLLKKQELKTVKKEDIDEIKIKPLTADEIENIRKDLIKLRFFNGDYFPRG